MNFEELGKKVKKFSKDTVTEVQKINEVRQLNSKVNDEKRTLEKIYLEMGKKLYDAYKDEPLAGFEEEFRQISQRFSTVDLLQDQIRAVKGVVLCPCCNMEIAATERFCSNCGTKMPEVAVIEDKVDEDAIEVHSEVVEPETVNEEVVEEAAVREPGKEEAEDSVQEPEEAEVEAAAQDLGKVEAEVATQEPEEAAEAAIQEPGKKEAEAATQEPEEGEAAAQDLGKVEAEAAAREAEIVTQEPEE